MATLSTEATLASDVHREPPAVAGCAAVAAGAKESLGDEQWAAVYREPELQELIRKALANNYDVRIAARRILEQEAQVRITHSQQFPTASIGGTGIGATLPSSAIASTLSGTVTFWASALFAAVASFTSSR